MNWSPISALPILVIVLVAIAMLHGCGWKPDPLEVYRADPQSLSFPVTTFATVPF